MRADDRVAPPTEEFRGVQAIGPEEVSPASARPGLAEERRRLVILPAEESGRDATADRTTGQGIAPGGGSVSMDLYPIDASLVGGIRIWRGGFAISDVACSLLSSSSSDHIRRREAEMTRQALMGVAMAAVALSAGSVAADQAVSEGRDGHRRVRGEVVWVDEARGSVTLKTVGGGAVALHLPPGAVRGLRKGDRLMLDLAVDRPQASGPKAGKPVNGDSGPRRPAAQSKD
ncbi:MAG: hypothetical protein ACRDG5_10855 [Anaerolineales bacterium]